MPHPSPGSHPLKGYPCSALRRRIGTELAAHATPDGYTLLMGNAATHAVNVSLFKKLPYDAVKDFIPITLIGRVPEMLVVHPALPAATVKDLEPYGERLATVARAKNILLMGCDQCCYERNIDGKLVEGAVIGCFPNLYSALSGNPPDQVITL